MQSDMILILNHHTDMNGESKPPCDLLLSSLKRFKSIIMNMWLCTYTRIVYFYFPVGHHPTESVYGSRCPSTISVWMKRDLWNSCVFTGIGYMASSILSQINN